MASNRFVTNRGVSFVVGENATPEAIDKAIALLSVMARPAEPSPAAPDWAVLGPKLAVALLAFWKLREKQLLALGYASLAEYEALCPENDEHLALRDAISLLPAA